MKRKTVSFTAGRYPKTRLLCSLFLCVSLWGGFRRFVSTRLRHLRLSPDGTTLVVKSEQGGVDHELALDELLEVRGQGTLKIRFCRPVRFDAPIALKGQGLRLRCWRCF